MGPDTSILLYTLQLADSKVRQCETLAYMTIGEADSQVRLLCVA